MNDTEIIALGTYPTHNNQLYQNPFARKKKASEQHFSTDVFISEWINKIFFRNKKIDSQAQSSIYGALVMQKSYQQYPCSIVYSMVRDQVKEISNTLKRFIYHSFQSLLKQQKYLCDVTGQKNAWNKQWSERNQKNQPDNFKNIYPTIARIYVVSIKYMTDASKEVYKLWKILYKCNLNKDILYNSMDASFDKIVREIFTQQIGNFKPKSMQLTFQFPLKVKYTEQEVEGRNKNLLDFYNDLSPESRFYSRQDLHEDFFQSENGNKNGKINTKFYKKIERLIHKSRIDCKIEKLRKYYLQNENTNNNESEIVFDYMKLIQAGTQLQGQRIKLVPRQGQYIFGETDKLQLIKSFEDKNKILFEIQDTSSQQEDLTSGNYFYQGNDGYHREQLIQQRENIEIQLSMNPEKHVQNRETEGSSKLSSSTGGEQIQEHQQLTMKNYELEPPPPQFIYTEDDTYPIMRNQNLRQITKDHLQPCQIEMEVDIENELNLNMDRQLQEGVYEKMKKLRININKTKLSNQNEKLNRVQMRNKRKLYEQKKQLQREKEELLREVERFMREKKREEARIAMMYEESIFRNKNNQCKHRSSRQHYQQKIESKIESNPRKYGKSGISFPQTRIQLAQNDKTIADKVINELMSDSNKMKQIEDAVMKDLSESYLSKPSKKQQKILKKLQIQQQKIPNLIKKTKLKNKQYMIDYNEKEIQLNNLMLRLDIDDNRRSTCNVDQFQIQQWKEKFTSLQQNLDDDTSITKEKSQQIVEKIPLNNKKKKKRHN